MPNINRIVACGLLGLTWNEELGKVLDEEGFCMMRMSSEPSR